MKSSRIIDHTADVRLLIEGDSPEELFLAGMEGMAGIIKKDVLSADRAGLNTLTKKDPDFKDTVKISSSNMTMLLIDFLSEVLTWSHINKAVYTKAEFKKLNENSIEATIFGYKAHYFDEDIKAVTYHEAEIKKNRKGNYETIIIFDI